MTGSKPNIQRAIVFQGGGALGAYEAGTYQQIYEKAKKESHNGSLFDIVAGTSIGAINSSVLVGHYLKNNSWDGSGEKLLEFWEGLMCSTLADRIFDKRSMGRIVWEYLRTFNRDIADADGARRFWSIFEFAFTPRGVNNMYNSIPQMGSKFLNPFTDFLPWWKYDYTPLRNYLSKFVDFPIKTSLEKGQPRLILTSVDIEDFTSPVVFDSYEKLHGAPIKRNKATEIEEWKRNKSNDGGDRKWYSEYGDPESRHVVFYDGIGPDQVLASALGKYAIDHPHIEDTNTGTMRQLWDGGYLSNTPLRELLTAHKNYWIEYLRNDQRSGDKLITQTPELEVYIVHLHPLTPKGIPQDKDLVDDRESDIFFHDRTSYDEQVAYAFTDFTSSTIRKLISAGQFDARISIDRMEIIFGIEELISEGIMSMEEGDEIMKEAREVITTEQLLYRKRKDEIEKAYNEYVEKINAKDIPLECKETLISPGKDIVTLVSEIDNSRNSGSNE